MELVDQAQHFAALGPVGGAGQSNDVATAFREGLDATERDSKHLVTPCLSAHTHIFIVFMLAQDSARATKQWYESTDRGRK